MSRGTILEAMGYVSEDHPTFKLRKSAMPSPGSVATLEVTAQAFRNLRQDQRPLDQQTVDFWCQEFSGPQEHARLFRDLHSYDPKAADRLADALTSMPEPSETFLGFRILSELGRGGFARVFLAEQESLAHRHVVVKVAAELRGEAQNLAQLQHPNIVPVYSVHLHGPFQAVCMPYLGWTTLHDVLRRIEAQPSLPTSGKALLSMFKKAPPEARSHAAASGPFGAAESVGFAETLARISYVEAIVWISAQIANGLEHAHEHGILHHDLKPANILLADDGRPMILDFNVAEDTKCQAGTVVAYVAGTLPYMAPEQLEATQGNSAVVDGRSDIYALGVIMYELLTGRYPFRHRNAAYGMIFDHLMKDRLAAPPRLASLNPAISPALEAIVRRCLEPDPANRYQTARALHEDLQRQHLHLPLLHSTEPSRRERMQKWRRRHPFLVAVLPMAIFFVLAASVAGGISLQRGQHLDELHRQEQQRQETQRTHDQALAAWFHLQDEMRTVQFLLYTRNNEPEFRAKGVALGTQLADVYGVLGNPDWREAALVAALPSSDHERLPQVMGELLLLVARGLVLEQADEPNLNRRTEMLNSAFLMNERAEACSAQVAASPALWRQRAILLETLGRKTEAAESGTKAAGMPLQSAADHYWLASDHLSRGQLREALPLLQKATRLEPTSFWAWFVLGNCYDRMNRDERAEACFSTCIALKPNFAWAYFNRGLTLHRQKMFDAARMDFDAVLQLKPEATDAYLNRALAHQGLGKFKEADADLTTALERGGPTRLYFLRARVRDRLGDKVGAGRDRDEGMRLPPTDEKSWVTRGYFQMATQPQAALLDFEEALRLNSRSMDALQNKAHVLAEQLGRNQEALAVLNRSLEFYPDSVMARGGRGVLYARLGQREPALRDAEETLRLDSSPGRLYQVACIYALTSKQQSDDRLQAFRLLSTSLRMGYGFNLLETDHDLDALRGSSEFRRLVDAARSLRPNPSGPKKA